MLRHTFFFLESFSVLEKNNQKIMKAFQLRSKTTIMITKMENNP